MWFLLAALNKCLFMKFAPEIFFDALLARSGRSKNSFLFFLDFFLIFWWIYIRIKVTAVVGVLSSGSLISTTFQETGQNESKVTKKFFGRGT